MLPLSVLPPYGLGRSTPAPKAWGTGRLARAFSHPDDREEHSIASKNKGGREARKPKADKKIKTSTPSSLVPPTKSVAKTSGK